MLNSTSPVSSCSQTQPSAQVPEANMYDFAAKAFEIVILTMNHDPYGKSQAVQTLLAQMQADIPPGMEGTFNLFVKGLSEGNGSQDFLNSSSAIIDNATGLEAVCYSLPAAASVQYDLRQGTPKYMLQQDQEYLTNIIGVIQKLPQTTDTAALLSTLNTLSTTTDLTTLHAQIVTILGDLGVKDPTTLMKDLGE